MFVTLPSVDVTFSIR